ncbi:MAG TPA: CDP-diacylglycerol--glycerol-3-phosphate 3-phosphatidyltransferase [Pirellulaceae bacterium]|jgi:CDP-diacylglycerol--glycerol-3-phosphate 3-phosphatidyltransferase|nr:CDP-diacylglycerol--glycerol-3-phosphate 3-phosphatidyltransferase [Pirellulaceae bacterium]
MTSPSARDLTILQQATTAPNLITWARFFVAIAVFVLLSIEPWSFNLYVAATVCFVIAASTDWVDGWLARKTGQVSKLGRILDPFCDKFLICGVFVYLAAIEDSGVVPWMAVTVLSRELLVTALRSVIEKEGGDFSAVMSGKLKMVFQCAAAVASLVALSWNQTLEAGESVPFWLMPTVAVLVWLAIGSTVYSGLVYVVSAAKMLSPPA